jgi:hypothetical protein
MSSEMARPITPNQPEKAPVCPDAPSRKRLNLTVETNLPSGRALFFEKSPTAPDAPMKKGRISSELDMSAAQNLGF